MSYWHIPAIVLWTAICLVGCSSKSPGKDPQNRPHKLKNRPPISLPQLPPPATLSASHILIKFQNAEPGNAEVQRTEEAALERANEAYKKLETGVDFARVVEAYSDCPSKESGGNLGTFQPDEMSPEFIQALQALSVGQISKPVKGPLGYHIIQRQELEKIYSRHILIMHKSSAGKLEKITRTKAQAKQRAKEVLEKLNQPGADFAALAMEYSDCPSKKCGGNLEAVSKTRTLPKFEKTAFKLKEWELSGIVETRLGFHIIQRIP